MAPVALQLACPICGSLHSLPKLGTKVTVVDRQCRYSCYWVISGFVAYDGRREMLKFYRHAVIRDLKFLRSASFPKTEEWRKRQPHSIEH